MRLLVALLGTLVIALTASACNSSSDDKAPTATSGEQSATPAATRSATTPAATTPSVGPTANGYRAQPVLPKLALGIVTGMFPIPGDEGFAYLLEKDGAIRRVSITDDGSTQDVVLDMTSRLKSDLGLEEGLLGLAFAPDFATSRRIYVNYTQGGPRRDTVSRFVMPRSGAADVSSEEILLAVDDPFENHNGGGMEFGPDGMLYIGFGDGGSGGDPRGNGQNKDALLGKLLRIDVAGATGYTIPPDNPFANGGGKGEIWAYGLRNPWRFDFDDETGALWLADVGQGTWEEVDEITKGGNYGWNIVEGPVCFKPSSGCDQSGLIAPRASYSHDDGSCSITGGYVYRGTAMPELRGWYVYGDFCSKKVWAVNTRGPGDPVALTTAGGSGTTAFAEEPSGELYMLDFSSAPMKLVHAN